MVSRASVTGVPFGRCCARTIWGTSSTIRFSPLTSSVSRSSARIWPRARALAKVAWASFRKRWGGGGEDGFLVDQIIPHLQEPHPGIPAHPSDICFDNRVRSLLRIAPVAVEKERCPIPTAREEPHQNR